MSYQIINVTPINIQESTTSMSLPPSKSTITNYSKKYGSFYYTGRLPYTGSATLGGAISADYPNPGSGFQIPNKCKSITFTIFYALQADVMTNLSTPTVIFNVVSQKGMLPTQYYPLPWPFNNISDFVINTDFYNTYSIDIPIEPSQWLEYYFISIWQNINAVALAGNIKITHKNATIRYNF
jgi:hypothetical protein